MERHHIFVYWKTSHIYAFNIVKMISGRSMTKICILEYEIDTVVDVRIMSTLGS